ncbi:MAG: PGF-pre-PGF domain-containing protein [Candidatus Thermoplasmatota archaeon]|nr:PGF-pre-PGF domain-containing protein [Candidatus Thermoplasmatota archaeon]
MIGDKRIGYAIKKFLSSFIVILMLMTSFSLIFVTAMGAEIDVGKGDNGDTMEVGDDDGDTSDDEEDDDESGEEDDDIDDASDDEEDKAIKSAADWLKDNYDDEEDDDESGEEDDDIDDASDDEEDKAIKSAADWLKDNYNNTVSFDDDDAEGEVKYGATEKIEIKVEKEIGNVSVGKKVIVKSEKSNQTSITGLEFVTSIDCKEVKFTVAKLKDRPEEITEEPTANGTIYRYLDIKLTSNDTYLHEEEFESMKFEFKVEKTWINENNVEKETITLIRYHDGWQHLSTMLLREDDNYVYYEAETPGLSTYTVVGTQIVEASPSIIKEKTVIPLTAWIAIIIVISMILIAVIYKLRFVYRPEKNT